MDVTRIESLSPRQLQALRLYADRFSAKQIGQQMGVSENTANSYIGQAAALVDAGGRQGAVAALRAYEETHQNLGYQILVGDAAPAPPASLAAPDEQCGAPVPRRSLLPVRQGAERNDLSVLQRVGWILIIAAAIAVGFGAVASAVRVANDVVVEHRTRK